jgi:hypothetical protein
MIQNVYWSSHEVPYRYSCSIVMKLKFSRKFFEKYSNTKFHENPYSGSQVVQCGQTDGQTDRHLETNSRFSQFFERPYNVCI